MGKIKEAALEGELFACDHFNVAEPDFIMKAQLEFGLGTIQFDSAISEWYQIQQDLFNFHTEGTVH